jgi:Phytanoyl-CoA dioxygenase (PhyH)
LEQWILTVGAGARSNLLRLNLALSDASYDGETQRWLDAIENDPPVLDASDMQSWIDRGVVVLHDAISTAECRAAVDAVYRFIGAEPERPETWPTRQHTQGIMVQLYQHSALEAARRSRRIHKAFAQLWESADLFPTVDRCSFNPPETESFIFPGPHLHCDVQLRTPVSFGVQGLIYLTDTAADQGAFACVPGFHREIEGWLRVTPPSARLNALRNMTPEPIPGRAGDLIMWHQTLPHGSSPNRTALPRVVQYIRMIPAPRAFRTA